LSLKLSDRSDSALSKDGTILATINDVINSINIYNLKDGRKVRLVNNTPRSTYFTFMDFSPDNTKLVTSTRYSIQVWNVETGVCEKTLEVGTSVDVVQFSPDGRTFVSGGEIIQVWNTETGKLLLTIETPGELRKLQFSPNGQHIMSVYYSNKHIHIWNIETGEQVKEITYPANMLSAEYNHDGQLILGSCANNTIYLQNVDTSETIQEFVHTTHAYAKFGPADTVITRSRDKLRVWSVTTGNCEHTLDNKASVHEIHVSPEGYIIALSGDGISVWIKAGAPESPIWSPDNEVLRSLWLKPKLPYPCTTQQLQDMGYTNPLDILDPMTYDDYQAALMVHNCGTTPLSFDEWFSFYNTHPVIWIRGHGFIENPVSKQELPEDKYLVQVSRSSETGVSSLKLRITSSEHVDASISEDIYQSIRDRESPGLNLFEPSPSRMAVRNRDRLYEPYCTSEGSNSSLCQKLIGPRQNYIDVSIRFDDFNGAFRQDLFGEGGFSDSIGIYVFHTDASMDPPRIEGFTPRKFVSQTDATIIRYEHDGRSPGLYLSEIISAFNFPATIYTSTCKNIHYSTPEVVALARTISANLSQ
jgi:hypothetical protein